MMQGISLSDLTAMPPQEQKQLLGERLYVRIMTTDPHFNDTDLAEKITGMLLEMDNADILHLLESREALCAKVQEAIAVLIVHNNKERRAPPVNRRARPHRNVRNTVGARRNPTALGWQCSIHHIRACSHIHYRHILQNLILGCTYTYVNKRYLHFVSFVQDSCSVEGSNKYFSNPVLCFLPLLLPHSPSGARSQIPPADIPGPTMVQGISLSDLTAMQPQEQKQLLGEHLYVSIRTIDPQFHDSDLAGKITGMLLEMDNGDILHLLESPDALREKVQEAIAVLEAHALHESALAVPTRAAMFTSVVTNHPALQVCKYHAPHVL